MVTINVRRLDQDVVDRPKRHASLNNRSLEGEVRHILECVARELATGGQDLHAPRLMASGWRDDGAHHYPGEP